MGISRRELMGSALAGVVGASVTDAAQAAESCCAAGKALKRYPNEHFYKSDGSFDADAAKAAFYEMFAYYNYPIVPRLKTEEFWATDFGLGKYTEIGMGGIFWLNLKEGKLFRP